MEHFHQVDQIGPEGLLPGQIYVRNPTILSSQVVSTPQRLTYNENVVVPNQGYEYPTSVKFDIYDPSGRGSILEQNLRGVCAVLSSMNRRCSFTVGTSTNKKYMDNFEDLIILVNDKFALTNEHRFKLDRSSTADNNEEIAQLLSKTLEVACNYKF